MNTSIDDLRARFALPGVSFGLGRGNLPRLSIVTPHASGSLYLYGAHVDGYQPAGQPPLLFMSGASLFETGRTIRGGIPVIFPWFGPRGGDPKGTMHGFVRVMFWDVESIARATDESVTATLILKSGDCTRAIWPGEFLARYSVTVGASLGLSLEIHNTGKEPFTFDEALHTYFAVGDVRTISVEGLAGAAFMDKTDGMKRKVQDAAPVRITGETDRLYVNTAATTTIHDPQLKRRITIAKNGSNSTVVWNPWIAKAKAMADFGDDEWPGMICIETVNAADNAVTLAPGASHVMIADIRSQAM